MTVSNRHPLGHVDNVALHGSAALPYHEWIDTLHLWYRRIIPETPIHSGMLYNRSHILHHTSHWKISQTFGKVVVVSDDHSNAHTHEHKHSIGLFRICVRESEFLVLWLYLAPSLAAVASFYCQYSTPTDITSCTEYSYWSSWLVWVSVPFSL